MVLSSSLLARCKTSYSGRGPIIIPISQLEHWYNEVSFLLQHHIAWNLDLEARVQQQSSINGIYNPSTPVELMGIRSEAALLPRCATRKGKAKPKELAAFCAAPQAREYLWWWMSFTPGALSSFSVLMAAKK